MPILFVHGVNVRDSKGWPEIEDFLRAHVAPIISDRPKDVIIHSVPWGDLGADPEFNGASIPDIGLIGMGEGDEIADAQLVLDVLTEEADRIRPSSSMDSDGLIAAGPTDDTRKLSDLDPAYLCDVVELAVKLASQGDPKKFFALSTAANNVCKDPKNLAALKKAQTLDEEVDILVELIDSRVAMIDDGFVAQGGGVAWTNQLGKTLNDVSQKVLQFPLDTAGKVVAVAARKFMRERLMLFFGDVFVYLKNRTKADGSIGSIPKRVLMALQLCHETARQQDEPLVVLSHSMGGQIIFDMVTHFLPQQKSDIKIDFWCAAASQVALFQEYGLFLNAPAKSNNRIPMKQVNHLGYWLNVWDPNDIISFTGKDIFDGIDEEPYHSGLFLMDAHGGYLVGVEFFKLLGRKLKTVLAANPAKVQA